MNDDNKIFWSGLLLGVCSMVIIFGVPLACRIMSLANEVDNLRSVVVKHNLGKMETDSSGVERFILKSTPTE